MENQTTFRLTTDYPRLNQWPQWWTAEPGRAYAVTSDDGSVASVDGAELATGLTVSLTPGSASQLRICPS